MSDALYQAHILDHYKRPRNFGDAGKGARCAKGINPSCGDSLTYCIETDEKFVKKATFTGSGCAISLATASMLTEKLEKMTLAEVRALSEQDIYDMLGIEISSGREKCALLSYRALQDIFRDLS